MEDIVRAFSVAPSVQVGEKQARQTLAVTAVYEAIREVGGRVDRLLCGRDGSIGVGSRTAGQDSNCSQHLEALLERDNLNKKSP